MERYNEYKDSGVQWLGEIPSHWETRTLKYCCSLKGRIGWNGLRSEEFQDISFAYLVTGQDFIGSEIDWSNCYQISQERYDEDPYIQLNNGDMLITKDGTIGKVAKVTNLDKPACLNSGIFVIKQKGSYFIQGFLYWMLCSNVLKEFNVYTQTGATIAHLYQNVFENMPCLLPPISEQQAIADYLDTVTSKIDIAIAQQQKMIDLLNERKQIIINNAVTKGLNPNVKMKDSGVDWIGEIPEEWIFCKLKHLTSIISKGTTPSTIGRDIFETGEIRFLKAENIVDNKVQFSPEFYIDDITHGMMKRSNLQKDDILFVIAGATIGKVAIMPKEFIPANTNQAISFIRLIDKSYAPYIWNVLQSDLTKKYIWQNAVQSAQPNISMEDLGNIQIPLPSKAEQIDILNYIENCIKPIEDAISNAEKQIAFLQERKQIIINEVVTGKIKVTK